MTEVSCLRQSYPIAASTPSLFLTPKEVAARYPNIGPHRSRPQATRRLNPQQGIALEILGHAIEYLVDSNFYHQRAEDPAVKDAISILKQSNRDVFQNAPEVVPARARAARWLRSHLHPHNPVQTAQVTAPTRLILVKR